MRKIKPVPIGHKYKRKPFLFKDLASCTHIFLCNYAKKSLERPYSGPHKVPTRTSERVYEIDVNGTSRQVSIENIKPAFFAREDVESILSDNDSSSNVSGVTHTLKTYARKKVTFKI